MRLTPSPFAADDVGNLVVDDISGDQTGTLLVGLVLGSNLGVDVQGAWDSLARAPDESRPFELIGEFVVFINNTLPKAVGGDGFPLASKPVIGLLDGSDTLIKVDVTTVLSAVKGVGPPWWVDQLDGQLTVLPVLGDRDARTNTRDVLVERKVDVRAIRGESRGHGASGASRTRIVDALDIDLVHWWVRWLRRDDWGFGNWGCHSAQEESGKSENAGREREHF